MARRILRIMRLAISILSASWLGFGAFATQPIGPEDWRTYNHNFQGTRFNAVEKTLAPGNVGKLEIKWRFPPKGSKEKVGAINATPSVVNGHVYFGTATFPKFYKLKPNGEVVWEFTPGDGTRRSIQTYQRSRGLGMDSCLFSRGLIFVAKLSCN